jgi:hypothetical protein
MHLTSEVYDEPHTEYFKEEEKLRQIILTLTDKLFRLDVFNRYNNTEEKFTFDTTMGTILDCYCCMIILLSKIRYNFVIF